MMETLTQDVRYAIRSMARAPGFAAAAIFVTALGVGANAATFSVADFVLLRPLPYPDSYSLVGLCEGPRSGQGWGCMNQLSPANYRDVAAATATLSALGLFQRTELNLVGHGEPVRVAAARVTADVLPLLGVPPLIGRGFDANPAGAADARTAVIGFDLWQSHFGGDGNVLGTGLTMDDAPYVVIGVMPPHFRFPSEDVQVWVPIILRGADFEGRRNRAFEGVGRLRPGVTFEQARIELTSIAARLALEYPATNAETGFSFFRWRDLILPQSRTLLLALCGASLCLLLLTCASLASLLMARAASRERELAVRAALGAGRRLLVRQMLTESVLLSMVGGAAGALVGAIALPLLAVLVPPTLPIAAQPTMDWRVLGFTSALSALTGLGFGLVPALRVGGRTGFAALRSGARAGHRTAVRKVLVTIEVAVSVALLIASGLLMRAMWRVQAVDPGFAPGAVLTMQTNLPSPRYDDPARRSDFYRRILAGVRALPGIESAAFTSGLPLVMTGGLTRVVVSGEQERLDDSQNASFRLVTPQFLSTLRIPLRAGRDVSETDALDRPLVAVVSESLARRHWPSADPIGRTFSTRGQTRTVVGVVGDITVRGLERRSEPQLYVPADQPPNPLGAAYHPKDLVVRLSRQDAGLPGAIREIVRRVDPHQPVSNVRMLTEVVGNQTGTRRAQLRVLVSLAVLALLITAAGINGLLAFTVSQRDREIGVRLALGADRRVVARMVMSEGVRIALVGVSVGAIVAYMTARGMSTLLFGVPPSDLVTISLVMLICFVTTIAAAARPAWRAARIQPMSALRAD
jgi:predicted permease